MAMVATDIKELFKISIKPRHDTITDQYNRIFMVKLLLACTIVTGISWYNDKINCLIPDTVSHSDDFAKYVSSTCWINGVYIYKQMEDRMNRMAFYGVPKDINYDGLLKNKRLCRMKDQYKQRVNEKCVEMDRTFYIQYQWLPFYLCAIALLYYLPYMMHKKVNYDMIRLSDIVKHKPVNHESIVKVFFKQLKVEGLRCCVTFQQILHLLIKILYVFVNALAFYSKNKIFNGEFYYYGFKWLNWSQQNNTVQFDYVGKREFPRPSNQLLPPFGFCELYSQAKDAKHVYQDHHKFVCEISQHVLYHYAFILLWFAILAGVLISVVGLLLHIVKYMINICTFCRVYRRNTRARRIYERLTYRQLEYLEHIRHHDVILYGEVVDVLAQRRKEYDDQRGGVDSSSRSCCCFTPLCCCIK